MSKKMKVTDDMKATLQRIATLQRAFWDALSDLENQTGVSLQSTFDFIDFDNPSDQDVRDVCKYAEEK